MKNCLICGKRIMTEQARLAEIADLEDKTPAVCPDCKVRNMQGKILFVSVGPNAASLRGKWITQPAESWPAIKTSVDKLRKKDLEKKKTSDYTELPAIHPRGRIMAVNLKTFEEIGLSLLDDKSKLDVRKLRRRISDQMDEVDSAEAELAEAQEELESLEEELAGYIDCNEIARPITEADAKKAVRA